MPTLHINGWTPPALAIAIALNEKGIDFEVTEHLWQDTPDAFGAFSDRMELRNSLEGEFPILVDAGTAVSDSYFVLEYLDDKYPDPPLRLADAYGQWQLQALARFFGERALPAVATLGVAERFGGEGTPADVIERFTACKKLTHERRDAWKAGLVDPSNEELVREANRKSGLLLERLERALEASGGPWLLGDRYTLADLSAYVLVDPFLSGRLPAPEAEPSDIVRAWHARVSERPAVTKVLAACDATFLPGPEHARWG